MATPLTTAKRIARGSPSGCTRRRMCTESGADRKTRFDWQQAVMKGGGGGAIGWSGNKPRSVSLREDRVGAVGRIRRARGTVTSTRGQGRARAAGYLSGQNKSEVASGGGDSSRQITSSTHRRATKIQIQTCTHLAQGALWPAPLTTMRLPTQVEVRRQGRRQQALLRMRSGGTAARGRDLRSWASEIP